MLRPSWTLAVTLCLLGGCGRVRYLRGDAPPDAAIALGRDAGPDDAWLGMDAAVDAPFDAVATTDAAVDAPLGTDAGMDAGMDAGLDAGMDAGLDAGIDVDAHVPLDSGRDAGTDASFDSGRSGPPAVVFLSRPLPATSANQLSADAVCAEDAALARLPGTFLSMVGTVGVDPFTRLGSASGWVRPDGRVVALSRATLLTEPLIHPIVLTADGTFVNRATTWMGRASDCAGWTSTSSSASAGLARSVVSWFGPGGSTTCAPMWPVYCFQTDARSAPSAPTPTMGRRLFVSDPIAALGAMTPDALCESSRLAAGLPTPARAYVAMTGSSALSRVTLDGRPWVRMDGLLLYPGDPVGFPLAPVLFDARGNVTTAQVSVGAFGPTASGSAASTCSDWTRGGMDYVRNVASPDVVSDGWFGSGVSQCDEASYRFYCLED